jgi:predicted CoA-substrate-specific enzyme activase
MTQECFAGLDLGSVSVKLAVLAQDGRLLHSVYARHKGRPLACARAMLARALERFPAARLAVTGGPGKLLAQVLGAPHVSELTATALGVEALHPEVKSVLEMGGEDSKLLLLEHGPGGVTLRDFALNSVCAAGTGAFLDQQAERMQLTLEEFAALALSSDTPARIAGRCSVFAKSDLIHLQQIATPLADMAAGLCRAVARNFRGSIVRGRSLPGPVALVGGVALNPAVAAAFRQVFELPDLLVPDLPAQMGALGAARKALSQDLGVPCGLDALDRALAAPAPAQARRARLGRGDFAARHLVPEAACFALNGEGPVPAYLGIDVGSISTNLVLLDDQGRLLAKRYLRTASRPIEAVLRGLGELGREIGARVRVRGAGVTGSGRSMIADLVRADLVRNEITAQARAAVFMDPEVDTVFEIGGQDSKYISIRDGRVRDFEMNRACAAGTGSFLEEQAERLGVPVKDRFQELALAAEAPCDLGERCTVFMESALSSRLQRGAGREDLLAGLAYSIVQNYMGRVVGSRPVGRRILFQGGTAFNKSVAAAFEAHLGREIAVPPHHDVTGAIGMALLAQEHMERTGAASSFRGFDLARLSYELDSFTCDGCENACAINRVRLEGEDRPLLFGGRCDKFDERRRAPEGLPDLFAFREQALFAELRAQAGAPAPRGKMGLPLVFLAHDLLPFYSALLRSLGFEPVATERTNRVMVRLGGQALAADTCHPVKAAFGHCLALARQGLPLFAPCVVNLAQPGEPDRLPCPLTQSFPHLLASRLRQEGSPAKVLAPVIRTDLGPGFLHESLRRCFAEYGVSGRELDKALTAARSAQERFEQALLAKGREVLDSLKAPAVVLLGRAYNAFDPGLNLDLPRKLAALGVLALPQDLLPAEDESGLEGMYWRSGRSILRAARFVRGHSQLFALRLGSFSCGPDSFIDKGLDREMAGKPMLCLEIDEHTADAGLLTRCEAFLDSIQGLKPPARLARPRPRKRDIDLRSRVLYGPRMSDHCLGMAAAFRSCGIEARVLPETGPEAMDLARSYVSGKECYPCAVTTADLLAKVLAPDFDPERSAFFMPGGSGPCRFGQYAAHHRLVLEIAGAGDVPLYSPVQDARLYRDLAGAGRGFSRRCWEAIVAFDVLQRCLFRVRPHELDPGSADRLYAVASAGLERHLADPKADIAAFLARACRTLANVARKKEPRPVIGVVGEIFVRHNRFSNQDLVRRIEALGGEVRLAGMDEWVNYVTSVSLRETRLSRDLGRHLKLALRRRVQDSVTRRLERAAGALAAHEPDVERLLDLASDYLPRDVRGEAVLTIGKALDLAAGSGRGAAGVVLAMPFGCMPGTIATALLREAAAARNLPVLALAFDGAVHPASDLALEAFMEQCRARSGR